MKLLFQHPSRLGKQGNDGPNMRTTGMTQKESCQVDLTHKIIIADDHPLYRAGLKEAVSRTLPDAEIIEADTLAALQASVEQHWDAELVLLDLHMPGTNGFNGLVWLRCQSPDIPVVVVSGSEEPKVMSRAITYGASGFIPKSSSLQILSAGIKAVLEGEIWLPEEGAEETADEDETEFADKLRRLTPKQFEILMKLNQGMLNKQIAYDLMIKESTVKAHVSAVLRKLKVYSRTQAVIEMGRLEIKEASITWD